MKRFSLFAGLLFCFIPLSLAQQAGLRTFKLSSKDNYLRVRHNQGLVQVTAWDKEDEVEVRFHPNLPEGVEAEQVKVFAWKSQGSVYVHSYLYANRGESVDIRVRVPKRFGVVVKGIAPKVDLRDLEGSLVVDTLRADMSLENVTGLLRVINREGDTRLRLSKDLRRNSYLRSGSGNIRCHFGPGLDLSVRAAAGKRLLWNGEDQFKEAHKLLGEGRPRLALQTNDGSIQIESETPALSADSEAERSLPRDEQTSGQDGQGEDATGSSAQVEAVRQPALPEASPGFTVEVDWVHLNVSVQDRLSGEYVTDLQEEDFQVWEEDRLQQIERFTSTEVPFHLLLLLDVSGSTEDYFDLLKQAVQAFTEQLDPEDRIALAVFNTEVRLIQAFTNDRQAMQQAIQGMRSGGGTSFYYSLKEALDRHLGQVRGRKAAVVFTDGVDDTLQGQYATSRGVTFREAFRAAQESDSLVYTIFLDTEQYYRENRRGRRAFDVLPERVFQEARSQLELIAQQTGGRIYTPSGLQDLLPAFVEIARQMRFQYTLGYIREKEGEPGQWRALRVTLKDRPNLRARHRRGFRIQPPR
ncbi:MAG TPA: VWA domain-containing protein [Acidobacteriota bacterium]|nr:VWA domain-containing protein [Acidobacteriota bacterium]